MYTVWLKPLMDRLFALFLLLGLLPLLTVMALFLLVYNKGSVFFTQQRPGIGAEPFTLIKFCTMTNERDLQGNLLPDAERLTAFGSFLRKTSLDELPQLINILKGDMSFVGPRPLLMEYLPMYTEAQTQRHNVKPGITGLAQVKGRNLLNWSEKFAYDKEYAENVSFALDLKIVLLTVAQVVKGSGVNQAEGVTMEKFKL